MSGEISLEEDVPISIICVQPASNDTPESTPAEEENARSAEVTETGRKRCKANKEGEKPVQSNANHNVPQAKKRKYKGLTENQKKILTF